MMVFDLFKRSSASSPKALLRQQSEHLLAAAMHASRDPGLYGPGRVVDDFSGRFDAVTLFATLVSLRLGAIGEESATLNQAFVNSLFKSFDDALREDGVGDLTVPKKMQRLAEGFYGRAAAYRTALENIESDAEEGKKQLSDVVFRNVLRGDPATEAFVPAFVEHVLNVRDALAAADLEALKQGNVSWPSAS